MVTSLYGLLSFLDFTGGESLLMDTQHPESYKKVQLLEAYDKFPRVEIPDKEFAKPNWLKQLQNADDVKEGEVVHLEGQVSTCS